MKRSQFEAYDRCKNYYRIIIVIIALCVSYMYVLYETRSSLRRRFTSNYIARISTKMTFTVPSRVFVYRDVRDKRRNIRYRVDRTYREMIGDRRSDCMTTHVTQFIQPYHKSRILEPVARVSTHVRKSSGKIAR